MFRIKEIYVRLIGIPVLGTILAFAFCPEGIPTALQLFKTICFTFVFWQGFYFIISHFRKRFPKIRDTKKRLLSSLFYLVIYLIVSDYLLRFTFDILLPGSTWEIDSYLMHSLQNFLICFAVSIAYELFYFYGRWHLATLETEQLKTQQISSQFEALKSQISPHFLFNSLNTLVTLIPEDPEQAIKFTQKLSEVYRYILQYQNRELVQLKTELKFIESFFFLLKMRYPENLSLEIRISEEETKQYVAPLTLQMLVENVIKHNVISKTNPLAIEIYAEGKGNIVVKNKLQVKNIGQNSTQKGLENIIKRYRYLSEKRVDIIRTNQHFMVSIPLLSLKDEPELI